MKSDDKLRAIQQEMIEEMKQACAGPLKELKRFCNVFGFRVSMSNYSQAEG